MSEKTICGIGLKDFVIRMEAFHGYRSPGIFLGGLMVEVGLQKLGPTPYLNVITETIICLPDAVQLLTPCTVGNGFLQILDWGKFALSTYDRITLAGIRVGLNHDQLSRYPLIHRWFERSEGPREKPPFDELAQEILTAGKHLIVHRPVRLRRAFKNSQHVPTGRCPSCGESYPLHFGSACPSCQGEAYYDDLKSSDQNLSNS